LRTFGAKGASAGVNYGVSNQDGGLAFYVMSRTHLLKARNIARNPSVSLVVRRHHQAPRTLTLERTAVDLARTYVGEHDGRIVEASKAAQERGYRVAYTSEENLVFSR
jgi:nitroimidazol reductase NimA-like FMN-containing flavoprotein (pyridoxamine 5'-phosphate oxidase superfamily)